MLNQFAMNIKTIIDKIPKEADIQVANYSVADRLIDVNQHYLALVEKAVQIGSNEPISKAEAVSETFTIVDGTFSQTFTRTIKNVPIVRVDFQPTGATYFEPMATDPSRSIGSFYFHGQRMFANEKQIFVEEGRGGTMRVTYARGNVVLFTQADYDNVTPPSPDWLPETFHDLLWLKPALRQAKFYKKDRAGALEDEYNELKALFDNHYGRNSIPTLEFDTEEERDCFGGGRNNR